MQVGDVVERGCKRHQVVAETADVSPPFLLQLQTFLFHSSYFASFRFRFALVCHLLFFHPTSPAIKFIEERELERPIHGFAENLLVVGNEMMYATSRHYIISCT